MNELSRPLAHNQLACMGNQLPSLGKPADRKKFECNMEMTSMGEDGVLFHESSSHRNRLDKI
eukprot:424051-Hanusia_phi.AAC.3